LVNQLPRKWLGLNLVMRYHMVIQKNSHVNNKSQESKSWTQKNMKPHKMCKWKTMKTQKKTTKQKNTISYFKSSKVIWDHTTKDYIPNMKKFEHVHIGLGS
jgi:hypothetical protein